ncbi:hypothetical protein [Sphingopyxis sp. MWB1]|nr:hypothetical protein [Sphingopyxis sp. MWB1]
MKRIVSRPQWLANCWTVLVDASKAAVAIHYDAPWERKDGRPA